MANTTDKEYQKEYVLRQLYFEQKMNQKEMGEELGCSASTISTYMRKFNIPTRGSSDYSRIKRQKNISEFHNQTTMELNRDDINKSSQEKKEEAIDDTHTTPLSYSDRLHTRFLDTPTLGDDLEYETEPKSILGVIKGFFKYLFN